MRAIVLAAGTGSRLGEMTKDKTKGMVQVNGKPLIDYLFEFFDLNFFDEIIVVGGFAFVDLEKHLKQKQIDHLKILENKDYHNGNIFTLLTALKTFAHDSFLITNVDHIYPRVMFEKMKQSFTRITAMCDFDRQLGPDDMKVKLDSDGKTVVHISKQLHDFDCGYIGMTYVDRSMETVYRDSAYRAIERFGEKAVVENILQVLAENPKTAPIICDLSGFGWYEVDDEQDLIKAEKGLFQNPNFS